MSTKDIIKNSVLENFTADISLKGYVFPWDLPLYCPFTCFISTG